MHNKKTILIFSTAYLPLIGGAELAMQEITGRIRDFDFVLITARMRRAYPPQERIGNVEVRRIGVGLPALDKILVGIGGMLTARRLMRERPVCLFWGMMASYASMAPALLSLLRLNQGVPFLLTLQEGDSEVHIARGRLGLVRYGWRFMLRHASHIQVISNYLDGMARTYGYTGDITLVPNGVDTNRITRNVERRTQEKKVIITVSRLVEKNGVDTLIRAFAEVYKKYPLSELHIVGDGPLRFELEALSRVLGVGKATTFFGAVPYEKVPEHLAEADIFARPSRSEGLGTAFLEAMAAGLPILGTPVGGIVDFLRDGETGLVCNVDDADDLADKICALLENRELYERLQKNGRQLVESEYSWDSVAERMKNIMNSLCAS